MENIREIIAVIAMSILVLIMSFNTIRLSIHKGDDWLTIMNMNRYTYLFSAFFILLVLEVVYIKEITKWLIEGFVEGLLSTIMVSLAILLPLTCCMLIAYFGLYKFWKELLKNGDV